MPAAIKRILYGRVASVDILRGIAMIIMALDHARDYFTNYQYEPTDLTHANAAYFLARWITHFCAPVFIFLSGSSAYFSMLNGKTKMKTAAGLLTRGLWLIVLELTIIRFGWDFNLDYSTVWLLVIWAIGWCMIALAGLIFLPIPAIAAISLIMIFGHNGLDSIHNISFGNNAVWWEFLHQGGDTTISGMHLYISYPVIPWIGVMGAGYCFGKILKKAPDFRDFWCYTIGISAILLFIILRWLNCYGDPHPWKIYDQSWQTLLSFLNCEKYPPSLLYLLMTLGPAIAVMPLLEKLNRPVSNFLSVYGKVPLFYYIVHIYLLHTIALVASLLLGFSTDYFTNSDTIFSASQGWGFPLPVIFCIWFLVVLALYLPCRWFMKLKQRSGSWWLSYL